MRRKRIFGNLLVSVEMGFVSQRKLIFVLSIAIMMEFVHFSGTPVGTGFATSGTALNLVSVWIAHLVSIRLTVKRGFFQSLIQT